MMSTFPKLPNHVNCFHHIQFYVSNSHQASFWYCFHFGFERFAHRRTAQSCEVAIRKNSIIFVFHCSIVPNDPDGIGKEVAKHGDFVKDVSFEVDNLDSVLKTIEENGLQILEPRKELRDEFGGCVLIARIRGSAGSIVHTLVQNIDFRGLFLPGFRPIPDFAFTRANPLPVSFLGLDHVVEAHPEQSLDNVVEWYRRSLQLHRFWSIDDKQICTERSALRALLVGNNGTGGSVKMTLVEPITLNNSTKSRRIGQIEQFLDFHGSSGIQHIAFLTDNIETTVHSLRERGMEFLDIPPTYYQLLEERLGRREANSFKIGVDLEKIRRLGILMDFDEKGYLLQIFTKPVQDRMTFFLEIIQRQNFNGFGAGNFQALFAAVEMEQKRREKEEEMTKIIA